MSASNDKPQIDKFREAARKLGLEDAVRFDSAVEKVAQAPKLAPAQIKDFARRQRGKPKD